MTLLNLLLLPLTACTVTRTTTLGFADPKVPPPPDPTWGLFQWMVVGGLAVLAIAVVFFGLRIMERHAKK